jgi:hypothetical protein
MECLNFIMRLSSASAPNKSSAKRKKTVSSGLMKRFIKNVSVKLSPLTSLFNKSPKPPSLKTQVATLQSKNTALESKATSIQSELNTTKAQTEAQEKELGEAKTEITGLKSEMNKKVTVLTAGLMAGVAGLIGGLLAYLGVQSGIKPTDDANSKKRKVMG